MNTPEMSQNFMEKIDTGEIVATKSPLAFDEDIYCKNCGHTFTLIEGNWEGRHPKFPGVRAIGLKCPKCERVNVAYYQTNSLIKLEKRMRQLKSGKQKEQAIRKYQREFVKVQKLYAFQTVQQT